MVLRCKDQNEGQAFGIIAPLPAVTIFSPGIFSIVLACRDAEDGGWVSKPVLSRCPSFPARSVCLWYTAFSRVFRYWRGFCSHLSEVCISCCRQGIMTAHADFRKMTGLVKLLCSQASNTFVPMPDLGLDQRGSIVE